MNDINAGPQAKHNEAAALVAQMTLAEKAACASGRNFWHMQGCERLGLPSVMVTDGPHGLRKQQRGADHAGLNASVPATCFPTASALAASWDVDLIHEIGVALGQQCVAEQVTVLLGPGINIKRHPLCGRNFEYFSEDPLLTGELAAAFINGVQSQGVGTSLKHYAVNNQEQGRMYVDAIVDERTLREIYLRGFEIAVKKSQPWTIMCAYNRLNGIYCGEHDWLLNRVLRNDWGFRGLVVTDWGATNDRVKGVRAGLDLEMPSSAGINDRRIEQAVDRGELDMALLDQIITRNVAVSLCGAELSARAATVDSLAHHALARRAAAESAVLLKNEQQILPLSQASEIAVIGAFARQPRYQGTGSSQVNPTQLDCAYDALAELVGAERLRYAAGYEAVYAGTDDVLLDEAVEVANGAEIAVVFAGLPETYESEGFDRQHMRLPAQHDALIEAVCAANPNTIVVLCNGAPVEMPWVDRPRAILECYLGGQGGGSAVADLLLGMTNPSGKLAETFPLCQTDVPSDSWFPGANRQVQYREGLYVGYRYFDTAAKPVLFPFGHGLSYAEFEFSNLRTEQSATGDCLLRVDVTNTAERSGAEVVQVYVHDLVSTAYRPAHELKAFAKVKLAAGERQTVAMTLEREAFALFDPAAQNWLVEGGEFEIRVGASSRDIRLTTQITVNSDDQLSAAAQVAGPACSEHGCAVGDSVFGDMLGKPVPPAEHPRPFHMNTSLKELGEHSWLGLRFKQKMVAQFSRSVGAQASADDPTLARMFEEMANHMPLRSFALFSGGTVNFRRVQLMLALCNHRYLEALRLLFGGDEKWD